VWSYTSTPRVCLHVIYRTYLHFSYYGYRSRNLEVPISEVVSMRKPKVKSDIRNSVNYLITVISCDNLSPICVRIVTATKTPVALCICLG
jgi:hypothetical protein